MPNRPQIIFLVRDPFSVRNLVETPLLACLAAQNAYGFCFVTASSTLKHRLAELSLPHMRCVDLHRPAVPEQMPGRMTDRIGRHCYALLHRMLGSRTDFANLAYRFNHIHQFAGHRQKSRMSPARRALESQFGNYAEPALGRPFPSSRVLFAAAYGIYYSRLNPDPAVEALFNTVNPVAVVIAHVQNPEVRPYSIAARRRRLPITGIVGSWDQLTTKGPVCAGIGTFVVQNQVMARELVTYHRVDPSLIEVTGWPQTDPYVQASAMVDRTTLLLSMGLDPDRRVLLFGLNRWRLGCHELAVARHLAAGIRAGKYGSLCSLILRPHPRAEAGETAPFEALADPPHVIVTKPDMGNLAMLGNLLRHADVVLTSVGTIGVEAAALDTCVIGVGFDEAKSIDNAENVRAWYELDHYVAAVQTGGIWVVQGYEDLDASIKRYLDDPTVDAEGRRRLRMELMDPLDGRSCLRLADIILREARRGYGGHPASVLQGDCC